MSAAPIAARPSDLLFFERRSRQRFPLTLAVQYRTLGKAGRFGSGQTLNISSKGLLFELPEPQLLSGSIELLVSWPCLLDGFCALNLVVKGRIVRSEGVGIAIESRQHEFRTAGPVSRSSRTQAFKL